MERPLWSNEDITPKQWKIESAEHLGCLVRHLAELLLDNIPLLAIRWTQLAMGMALSSSNRHIAGRCFQIASALCQVIYFIYLLPQIWMKMNEMSCFLKNYVLVAISMDSWFAVTISGNCG